MLKQNNTTKWDCIKTDNQAKVMRDLRRPRKSRITQWNHFITKTTKSIIWSGNTFGLLWIPSGNEPYWWPAACRFWSVGLHFLPSPHPNPPQRLVSHLMNEISLSLGYAFRVISQSDLSSMHLVRLIMKASFLHVISWERERERSKRSKILRTSTAFSLNINICNKSECALRYAVGNLIIDKTVNRISAHLFLGIWVHLPNNELLQNKIGKTFRKQILFVN